MRAETRRQLKQDSFNRVTIGAADATLEWSVENKNKLFIAAAVMVVLIAAVIGAWYYSDQRNDAASLAMDQAVRTLQTPLRPAGTPAPAEYATFASAAERASTAHQQFQSVVDNYPHTHSADFARYFLAVTDADMGKSVEAERKFNAVAALSDNDVSALAQFALASIYRSTNRTKDAIDIYKKLIDKPSKTVSKAMAEMELADTYQVAGQVPEAKRILTQLQKENPGGEVAQMATQKMQELK